MTKIKNIILKRKKSFIFIIVLIILLVIYFCLTHQINRMDDVCEISQPINSDANYLNVWDLRFAFSDSELEKLGNELFNTAYENDGILPDKYNGIISKEHYYNLCPKNKYLNDDEKKILFKDDYKIKIDVKKRKDKAIIFYDFSYHAFDKNNKTIRKFSVYNERMYLKKENDTWRVIKSLTYPPDLV